MAARVLRTFLRWMSDRLHAVRPQARARPPGERTILDDLAMRRPWNIRVKAERALAKLRIGKLEAGVTVIIVNWNTGAITTDVIRAVQALSPASTRILVIDNGSTDDSRRMFDDIPGIERLDLRSNAGHGVALDIGVCRTRTDIAVTLDSDAIPLRSGWLDRAVEAVRKGDALLAGSQSSRDFVHPIYLAIRVKTFLADKDASFQVHTLPGSDPSDPKWGVDAFDTAELLSRRFDQSRTHMIPKAPNPAPGLPGMSVAEVLYHHGGVSRASDGALTREAVNDWRKACGALGLSDVLDHGNEA